VHPGTAFVPWVTRTQKALGDVKLVRSYVSHNIFEPLADWSWAYMLQNCVLPIQCTRESFRMFLAYPHTRPRLMAGCAQARRLGPSRTGRCKSTCMNSMQTGIMPCATFRTVPFQQSRSHSFENYPISTFRALVFLKAHSHAKCFSAKWQHDNGGA
jgi:hypothetical protein